MPTRTTFPLVICGCALVAFGFLAGRLSVEPSREVAPPATLAPFTRDPSLNSQPSILNSANGAPASFVAVASATSSASEEATRAALQHLAARDPATALRLAAEARTPRQRELFRNAALLGWATRDARAAADWTLANVRAEERRAAVEAIATGAANHPEEAVTVFRDLIAADPQLASEHGNSLAAAFANAGDFDDASAFAVSAPEEYRAAWLCTVYYQWAIYQPQAALAAIDRMADPTTRSQALDGVFSGWSASDPAGLVAYAVQMPAGEARTTALQEGLSQWVERAPIDASDWMDKRDPSPDLDSGAAAIALTPVLVERRPDVAASWAESITDPDLRFGTVMDLIRMWGTRDATGARHYAATTPALRDDQRQLALAALQPSP